MNKMQARVIFEALMYDKTAEIWLRDVVLVLITSEVSASVSCIQSGYQCQDPPSTQN